MKPSASGTPLSAYIGEMQKLLDDLEARELKAAWVAIDQYRKDHPNLEPLGEKVLERGDGQGTVALITVHGRGYVDTNSGFSQSDTGIKHQNKVFDLMKVQGMLGNAKKCCEGASQVLTHAEARVLIQAYFENGENPLPSNLVMNVDRETCPFCTTYLPNVLQFLGVQVLTIYAKNNVKWQCVASKDPKPDGKCVKLREANS